MKEDTYLQAIELLENLLGKKFSIVKLIKKAEEYASDSIAKTIHFSILKNCIELDLVSAKELENDGIRGGSLIYHGTDKKFTFSSLLKRELDNYEDMINSGVLDDEDIESWLEDVDMFVEYLVTMIQKIKNRRNGLAGGI